jgi:hypothetical protein
MLKSNLLLPHSLLGVISYSAIFAGLVVSIVSSFDAQKMPKIVLHLQIYAAVIFSACTITGFMWSRSAWYGENVFLNPNNPIEHKVILSYYLALGMVACTIYLLAVKPEIHKVLAMLSIEFACMLCVIFFNNMVSSMHGGGILGLYNGFTDALFSASDSLRKQGILGWTLLGLFLFSVVIGLLPAYVMKQKGHSRYISWWIYGAALPVVAIPHAILMKAEQSSPHILCKQDGQVESAANQEIVAIVLGGILGLLVSYMFKPVTFSRTPTMGEWFAEGIMEPTLAPIIITCGIVGAVAGWFVGRVIKSQDGASKQAVSSEPGETPLHLDAEAIYCTQCGMKNLANAKFCKSCGSPI